MRATVAADDTNHFFFSLCVSISVSLFLSPFFSLYLSLARCAAFNAMCDDVARVCFEIVLFLYGFFSSLYSAPKCSFKNNLGNIKFVYLDAHYLARRERARFTRRKIKRDTENFEQAFGLRAMFEFTFNYNFSTILKI